MIITKAILVEYKEQLLLELSNNFCLSPDLDWRPCELAHEILVAKINHEHAFWHYQQVKREAYDTRNRADVTATSIKTPKRSKNFLNTILGRFNQKKQDQDYQDCQERALQQCFDKMHLAEIQVLKLLALAYTSGLPDQSQVKTVSGIPVSLNNQSLKDLFLVFLMSFVIKFRSERSLFAANFRNAKSNLSNRPSPSGGILHSWISYAIINLRNQTVHKFITNYGFNAAIYAVSVIGKLFGFATSK